MSNLSRIEIDPEKLRNAAKGYTLQQLASQLGKTRAAVGHYLTGQRTPPGDVLVQLCVLLDISDVRKLAKNFSTR